MRQSRPQLEANHWPKWFTSPVRFYKGTLTEIRANLPEFERRSFALAQPGSQRSRLNQRLDIIVRMPFGRDPDFIPIGVVSKEYVLVPHADVLDVASQALKEADIASDSVKAQLTLSQYGERMSLRVCLPGNYSFDPGDGHPLALRLECFNSVDGSTRFRALMGWFRFVCSNGLILGVTSHDIRRRHVGDLTLDDVRDVLASGIQESEKEKENFKCWLQRQIHPKNLVPWVEKDLREKWGFKAAARAYHISQTGYDVQIIGPYKDNSPVSIPVRRAKRVPGIPESTGNLYHVSQILAWLAKERRDVQEQLQWREQIPQLLEPLLN